MVESNLCILEQITIVTNTAIAVKIKNNIIYEKKSKNRKKKCTYFDKYLLHKIYQ